MKIIVMYRRGEDNEFLSFPSFAWLLTSGIIFLQTISTSLESFLSPIPEVQISRSLPSTATISFKPVFHVIIGLRLSAVDGSPR